MATVSTGMNGNAMTVVLQSRHEKYDITEHMDAQAARRTAIELMSAAGRVERSNTRPDWP